MLSGSQRSGAPLTLVLITVPILSGLEEILAMAHVINQVMRKEDLCGRTGHVEFVIVLSGSVSSGQKFLERVGKATNIVFTSEIVEWVRDETSLELLYRLDLAAES
jgi:GGDEF domain-containing protein